MEKPIASIVIPTLNSEQHIEYCIKSLLNQTCKNLEIIVVDGGSNDKTLEVLLKYPNVKVIVARGGRSYQKNLGAYNASGKYVYFIDSDFYLESIVVEKCITACEVMGYDAVAVNNIPYVNSKSIFSKATFWHRFYLSQCRGKIAARFIRKDVFLKLGGFNTTLYFGEDLDLHRRIKNNGFKIGLVNVNEYHLGEPTNTKQYLKRYLYYSPNIIKYITQNKYEAILHIISIYYILKAFKKTPSPLAPYILALEIIRLKTLAIGYIIRKAVRRL